MRQHLYRGFHFDVNGKTEITLNGVKIKGWWIYWYASEKGTWEYVKSDYTSELIKVTRPYGTPSNMGVIPETVGQWARIDKDGNGIFEDDIIGIHQFLFDGSEYENELIGRVVWDDERVCWAVDHIDHKQIQRYMSYDDDVEFRKIKVAICNLYGLHEESYRKIGNIFENPELLEIK